MISWLTTLLAGSTGTHNLNSKLLIFKTCFVCCLFLSVHIIVQTINWRQYANHYQRSQDIFVSNGNKIDHLLSQQRYQKFVVAEPCRFAIGWTLLNLHVLMCIFGILPRLAWVANFPCRRYSRIPQVEIYLTSPITIRTCVDEYYNRIRTRMREK